MRPGGSCRAVLTAAAVLARARVDLDVVAGVDEQRDRNLAQPVTIFRDRMSPMPSISRSRSGVDSMTSNSAAPNALTSLPPGRCP
jgi:hypothetical protein